LLNFFEQFCYFSQVGVDPHWWYNNGNQTTEIIRNETRFKMMVEMVQFNFGEKNTLNLWPNFEERAPVEILDIIWLF